jgi:hypothetical protein
LCGTFPNVPISRGNPVKIEEFLRFLLGIFCFQAHRKQFSQTKGADEQAYEQVKRRQTRIEPEPGTPIHKKSSRMGL